MKKNQNKVEQTSPEHKIRQSINAKVEHSEKDIKDRFAEWFLPLYVITFLNIFISIVAIFG